VEYFSIGISDGGRTLLGSCFVVLVFVCVNNNDIALTVVIAENGERED